MLTTNHAHQHITREKIESLIIGEYGFRASEAVFNKAAPHHPALELVTFCVLVLRNGSVVTGVSTCLHAESFDAKVGYQLAREDALREIWALEGYLIKQLEQIDSSFNKAGA